MRNKLFLIVFLTSSILYLEVGAQFWKLNSLNQRDMFILDTKASMASGICYKQVPATFLDPHLKFQTISFCCEGYIRDESTPRIKCDPICSEDCDNGICSAPDICECYPGYERVGGRCEEI